MIRRRRRVVRPGRACRLPVIRAMTSSISSCELPPRTSRSTVVRRCMSCCRLVCSIEGLLVVGSPPADRRRRRVLPRRPEPLGSAVNGNAVTVPTVELVSGGLNNIVSSCLRSRDRRGKRLRSRTSSVRNRAFGPRAELDIATMRRDRTGIRRHAALRIDSGGPSRHEARATPCHRADPESGPRGRCRRTGHRRDGEYRHHRATFDIDGGQQLVDG